MASNRKAAREALATLLTTALVGSGKPVQALYDYRPADFGGQSPVVTVSSAGTRRRRMTAMGSRATPLLRVDMFVVYSDQATWTEADTEDALDDLEAAVAGVLDDNQRTAAWQALDYADASQRMSAVIGGVEYAWESIQVAVEVYG